MFCNDCVSKLLNKPPYGQQKQANGMFREMSAMRSHMTFEARIWANITWVGLVTNWPLSQVSQQKSCFKSEAMSFSGREVAELATKLR